MRLELPQYSGKDTRVMAAVVPLFSVMINFIIFGKEYFLDLHLFLSATIIAGIGFTIDFILCGWVAVSMKHRFPREEQILKRLTVMILTFLVITALFLYALFRVYELVPFFYKAFDEWAFAWSFFAMGIINIFLTFLMEGISRYENWKQNWAETEKLKKAYKQSQLQGLKSQLNQHFLFNSLNSLSSLIQEDEERAEQFLDEMTKVYRYMLRLDEEKLVTVETELKFIESYRHLLKARFGDGLEVDSHIQPEDRYKLLPPLTLQVIVENAFSHNEVSKSSPLKILITSGEQGCICVTHNVQPKIITATLDTDAALDNLISKYELLSHLPVRINETDSTREILLPLLLPREKEEVAV